MNQQTIDDAPALGKFVFHCFLVVADAEDNLGPREVERFHELLTSPAESTPPALRESFTALREQYAELWKAYQGGSFGKTPSSVGSHWMVLQGTLGEQAPAFAAGLLNVLGEVVKAGSPMLAMLGLASNGKARALDRLRALLAPGAPARSIQETPAAVTPATQSASPARSASDVWPAATLVVGKTEGWTRGKTKVRCVAVVPETRDVKSFYFVADPPLLFTYAPGQFVTFELPIDGKTVRRSYTISSSPTRPYTISITVKRIPGGRASSWLHDHVEAGTELTLFGPNGDFTCFHAPAPKLLLIGAGSGVTPVMSMLRWLCDTFSPCDVVFLNFVHSPQDVIFADEIRHISARMGGRLRLGIIPSSVHEGQPWNGPTGHVADGLLRFYAPDYAEREVFVCGPAGFMDVVKATLGAAGHPAERYHQESFGGTAIAGAPRPAVPAPSAPVRASPAPTAKPTAVPTATSAAASEIVFRKSGKTVKCTIDDAILDVAESNGIAYESSCRAGTCGTCKTKKIEGTVHLDEQQVLSEADISEGFILACVGRAEGRVVLDA